MSSKAVKDAFETSWLTLMSTLDLEDTTNNEPDRKSLSAQWATVDYSSFGEKRVSLSKPACRRETGNITVVVFVKAGTGDVQASTLSKTIRDVYRDWKDPSRKITITEASPGEQGGESNGRWFAESVNLFYTFDQYI